MSEDLEPRGSPRRSRARLESLSDAVFAIALTLLVLNIRLDRAPHETFAHAFHASLPQLLAYALSFSVIALYWLGHHRLFASLASADHGLVMWNFLYLGVVALVPFPSQVLGSDGRQVGAVILYASVLLVGSCVSAAMWLHARRRGLLDPGIPRGLVAHSVLRSLVFVSAFAISIPIALLVGATAAEWTWLVALPARLLLARRYGAVHDIGW